MRFGRGQVLTASGLDTSRRAVQSARTFLGGTGRTGPEGTFPGSGSGRIFARLAGSSSPYDYTPVAWDLSGLAWKDAGETVLARAVELNGTSGLAGNVVSLWPSIGGFRPFAWLKSTSSRRICVAGCAGRPLNGCTVTITGPAPSTATVFTCAMDGSHNCCGIDTLGPGTYTRTVTPPGGSGYATSTFTGQGGAMYGLVTLAPDGTHACCTCGRTWPRTLYLSTSLGVVTLTASSANPLYWQGSQRAGVTGYACELPYVDPYTGACVGDGVPGFMFLPLCNPCGPTTTVSALIQWRLWCGTGGNCAVDASGRNPCCINPPAINRWSLTGDLAVCNVDRGLFADTYHVCPVNNPCDHIPLPFAARMVGFATTAPDCNSPLALSFDFTPPNGGVLFLAASNVTPCADWACDPPVTSATVSESP